MIDNKTSQQAQTILAGHSHKWSLRRLLPFLGPAFIANMRNAVERGRLAEQAWQEQMTVYGNWCACCLAAQLGVV